MSEQTEFLYKYRAIDDSNLDYVRRIFTHNEIYLAAAEQFNDPFDCRFSYSFKASEQEARSYFTRLLDERFSDWNRQQKRAWMKEKSVLKRLKEPAFRQDIEERSKTVLRELGIYSLTRVPDDILMWSHYADSHRGFCLVFDHDPNEWFIARSQTITYTKTYPVVNPIIDDVLTRLEKALLTKAKHWEYEKEWRIIDHESGPGIKHFPAHILTGVILGCKISDEHRDMLTSWCSSRSSDIALYQAKQSSVTYSLEIVKI